MKQCLACGQYHTNETHACPGAALPSLDGRSVVREVLDGLNEARAQGVQCDNPEQITMENPLTAEQTILNIAKPQPRRIKALATNKDCLLAILLLNNDPRGKDRFQMAMVDSSSLPADLAIDDVVYDNNRDCFLIIVSSESFGLVQPECVPEIIDLPIETWDVARILPDQVVVSREAAETGLAACIELKRRASVEATRMAYPEPELGPKIPIEFPDWKHQDHATEMREQTDLLKQIRDAMIEGAKEARERVFTEALCKRVDQDVEHWNRDKGIIKPSEIIVEVDLITGLIDAIREDRSSEAINFLQARLREAAPEHQPRSGGAQKAGNVVKQQSQP